MTIPLAFTIYGFTHLMLMESSVKFDVYTTFLELNIQD